MMATVRSNLSIALLVLAWAIFPAPAAAQPAAGEPLGFVFKLAAKPDGLREIPLGTGRTSGPPEQWFLMNGELNVRNVAQATLTPVLPPPGKRTGTAVIVAPGGGFLGLAIGPEGFQIAHDLAAHGIAAFVLKYRVLETPADLAVFGREMSAARSGKPSTLRPPPDDTPPSSLADAIAAIRLVKARAAEFGVDPDRVGMMGFSAGAFTTLSVVRADQPDARLAFVAPIYGPLRPFAVPVDAPPMFDLIAADDFLFHLGTGLIESYRTAGRSVEFHMLASGGHGFGIGKPHASTEGWMNLFYNWLGNQGFLKSRR